jgi:hypothetical protein
MNIRTKGSTRVATSVALVALLMAGDCGPLQAEGDAPKEWFNLPSMPQEPPTTAQSLRLSEGPTVVGNEGKEWKIDAERGKATYKYGDCELELRWSQPPHWLHPGWKFPMAIGGKIVKAPSGSLGTSIRLNVSGEGKPPEVEKEEADKKGLLYVGRSGHDGRLYPKPDPISWKGKERIYVEKAEGHEQQNDFHLTLPRENSGKSVKLEFPLGYGPTIVYTYKP